MSLTVDEVREGIVSGELTRERMCDGKKGYWSRAFAEETKRRLDVKFGKTHEVYPCPFCGKHHLATGVNHGR